MLFDDLEHALAELDRTRLRRRRRVLDSPAGPRVTVDGRQLLSFCGNDYLGLAADSDLVLALAEGARQWGAGSAASHLLGGHLRPHEALEQRLAAFLGMPRALTFATGYMANLAVAPALVGRGDEIFADRLNHASLIDAALLSRAGHRRYPHNDWAALERLLAASTARRKLILTDGVFSMDGDVAPLDRLFALAERFDAWLVVDDAHGFGVLGAQGRGVLSHFGLPASPRLVLMGTLGKAAGVGGAFVAGDERVIEWLISRARSYIFSTAAPPALAAALQKSVDLIEAGDDRRRQLQDLITRLREGLAPLAAQRGWRLADSATAIQPVIVGDNRSALELSAHLERQGIWVPAIRPPTVPEGSSRLRISLSAAHGAADVDALLAALRTMPPTQPETAH
ncbi:8-amino-7-oxononanoate synthase [Denitratisoma sp. DHT3]|uniref:8-amino-7-oxononanoate synthase n=1 Tax=Denitratisoma sp. DHT3 TaxID=1981880 RepID=UPI0011986E9F|nr:8-amino-7-oxononanoate synthase [Denitratisoma sp. DHT3]QDX80333.1 8-amino-7-oxononanoate synthase [Denitratisoma sp. DHT3]